jgi:dolichol-phosphate mannosyltransferase
MTSPAISVVVPLHNEQMVLPELLRRVGSVLSEMPGGPHEMIFVDDGSSDATLQILEEAASGDTRISVIVFARNFGHQPALTAALDHVSGDVTVILDGDLQDPPESIPALVAKFLEGYDVVCATHRRKERFFEARVLRVYRMAFVRHEASGCWRFWAGIARVVQPGSMPEQCHSRHAKLGGFRR